MKSNQIKALFVAGLLLVGVSVANAQASTNYANATVSGALLPGVYGRIEIGTAPPPPVIYSQPVVIYRTQQVVQQPLYLHVPPGHAKKWSKHCSKYNACAQPVYFVRVDGDHTYEQQHYADYKDKKKDKHEGHGKGKSKHDD